MSRFAVLKALKHIFFLVFLSGMIYTAFNYLPIIEEESSSKKIELAGCAQSDAGGDCPDEDSENDGKDFFHTPSSPLGCAGSVKSMACTMHHRDYLPPSPQLNTPPPRF